MISAGDQKNIKLIHMKKRVLILLMILVLFPFTIQAQKILTLKECYDHAITASALASEKKSYSDISRLKDDNLVK
jgi:hypothetical protein